MYSLQFRPMAQHDNGYKNLFSHPQMVRDLLVGFVHEPWVAELDWNTLEKVSGSYVTDDLRDREDDIVWRVRFNERWLYVYLLLEFQSSVNEFMAVRLLTYLGLLYQDIIKQKMFTLSGRLPPVLPLVLYNGVRRWNAAQEISALIEVPPGRLQDYTPHLKYLLLDEGAIDESAPLALQNLTAALFRLEKSRTPTDMVQAVAALVDWLQAPEQTSVRRAFAVWIRRVLLPSRLPKTEMPEVGDLLEIKTMLAETVMDWTQQWLQQGLETGRQEGRQAEASRLLERQLTKRFGPLPPTVRTRLAQAAVEQLEDWAERILDATSLDAVFTQDSQ